MLDVRGHGVTGLRDHFLVAAALMDDRVAQLIVFPQVLLAAAHRAVEAAAQIDHARERDVAVRLQEAAHRFFDRRVGVQKTFRVLHHSTP